MERLKTNSAKILRYCTKDALHLLDPTQRINKF